MRTIQCKDCGADYQTKRGNTLYCRVCRLYRNAIYLRNRTSTCIECESKFAPLETADILCGNCDFTLAGPSGTCAICRQETDRLIHEDIKVCTRCAKDPGQRTIFLRALAKKRRANKEAATMAE